MCGYLRPYIVQSGFPRTFECYEPDNIVSVLRIERPSLGDARHRATFYLTEHLLGIRHVGMYLMMAYSSPDLH